MKQAATCATLEDVDVECTHCKVAMTSQRAPGSFVRYFHCSGCHRWVSSTYTEVFKSDAKVRTHKRGEGAGFAAFNQVKDRLERWLNALDDQDPYRTLGVSPMESADRIRERYRELALKNHPDRGGSVEAMRKINDAYERTIAHRERRQAEALAAGASRGLPTGA